MRYARPQIRRSHNCHLVLQDPQHETNSKKPGRVRRAQVRGISRSLVISLMVACHVSATDEVVAQSPKTNWLPVPVQHPFQGLNRLGRLMGWGVSDGYHASAPGKTNPVHNLPPRSAWITEPVRIIEHPSATHFLHEIHDVNRNRTGFFDPYIDYSMVSPPHAISTHHHYADGMASPSSTYGQIQATDKGIGPGASREVAPEPLHTNTAPLPIPTPTPRNPREQTPPKPPTIRRQPSVLDTLPSPQKGPQQTQKLPPPAATQTPPPNQQPTSRQPISQPYTSPVEGYSPVESSSGTPESTQQIPSQTVSPTPAIQSDPLNFPIIPEGTQDPLPQPRIPRGNLLPEPAAPPGVDPLDEFRRSPGDLRQTKNLPQRQIAPKRIPRISNRIFEPISH